MLNAEQLQQLRQAETKGRNKLQLAMDLADVTQAAVAEGIGSTQPHVSAISLGRYGKDGLPLETTRRIASFFGCTIEDLFPSRAEVA